MPIRSSLSIGGMNHSQKMPRVLGLSSDAPAPSGYWLAQNPQPGATTTGWYWIKSGSMPSPLQMYVNMTQEGGGYDFYFITGGPSFNNRSASHGGTSLGLDFVYPRSKQHWQAMYEAVRDARPAGTIQDYFQTAYGVWSNTPGNYTGVIMRNPTFYGSGTSAWQVNDGGRWWLRDTTFGEPNGDYTAGYWLGGYGIADPYTGQDMGFNDLTAGYFTGNYYLVSTNAKP